MNCGDVLPLLDLLSDSELEAKDAAMVLAHLEGCAACQNEWQQIQQLRSIFKQARENTTVPATLLEKIDNALLAEEKSQSGSVRPSKTIAGRYLAVAASPFILALIASLFVLIKHPTVTIHFKHDRGPAQTAEHILTTEDLVADAQAATPAYSKPDLEQLAQSLGWDLKYVSLPEWKMQSARKLEGAPIAAARFGFTKATAAGEQHLWCYQARSNSITLRSDAGTRKNIAGKGVALGRQGDLSYALWSQNNRDYLFVSDVSQPELEKIVAGT